MFLCCIAQHLLRGKNKTFSPYYFHVHNCNFLYTEVTVPPDAFELVYSEGTPLQ